MLTSGDVETRLREVPFHPFGIVTSAGQTHDVYHPDLVMIGRRFLTVGIPSAEAPSYAEQVTRLSMMHITELCDLPAVTK